MGSVSAFDVFLSYARRDRDGVRDLRDALVARGLRVWIDDTEIDTFTSISAAIEQGLARSTAMVAYYSAMYPRRRACQWELTAALLAAQRAGDDPLRRVFVVNPETGTGHIEPVQLQDAPFSAASAAGGAHGLDALAQQIVERLSTIDGELGELGVAARPAWMGRRPVGAARFVGRVRDMWRVHSALTAGSVGLIAGAHTSDPMVMVTGMGGVGKSLLAQEYALRFAAGYPGGVFWLRAHGHDDRSEDMSREAPDVGRDAQLLAFARELGRPSDGLVLEQLPRVLAEELDRRRQPFLWIVDDLPPGLSSQQLEAWCAPGRHGRTLLTTRSREYHRISKQIDLGVLSPEEGYELLVAYRVPDSAEDERAARELVEDLGAHALALDVTGAALRAERGVRSFAQYRAALANRSHDELAIAARLADQLPNGHEASIATTLARSITELDEPARDFLRLASRLAPDPIALLLVVGTFALADDLGLDPASQRAVGAIEQAAAHSLADDAGDDNLRRVHTLISRTVELLERDSPRGEALADGAIKTLTSLLDAPPSSVPADAKLLAHARCLTTEPLRPHHAALLSTIAFHDWLRGDYAAACMQQERVVTAEQGLLADAHPNALIARANLASTYRAMGRTDDAIGIEERLAAESESILGDKHPVTLTARANLAMSYELAGRIADAIKLGERVLAQRERILGKAHSETLNIRSNLASWYASAGRTTEGIELGERVLAEHGRILGARHPYTLASGAALADSYESAGRIADAIALKELVLARRERVLGDEHPDTLRARAGLAASYGSAGRTTDAIKLRDRVRTDHERILGDEHSDTLASRARLAMSHEAAGRTADAINLQERVVSDSVRLLGYVHPTTLIASGSLANLYRSAGRTADAIKLQERVLNDADGVLGAEHRDLLTMRSNLALSYQAAGRTADAIDLQERVLLDGERILGVEHPDTLGMRTNLALSYKLVGRTADAIGMQERALTEGERILGAEHRDMLIIRSNLAMSYQAAGRPADAVRLETSALAHSERTMSTDHPDTLIIRANLGFAYWSAGQTADAITVMERVVADSARILGAEHPSALSARANLAESYRAAGRTADAITLLKQVLGDSTRAFGKEHPHTRSFRASLAGIADDAPGSSARSRS